ncbi:lipopolysaccharide biosynthesis protein [Novosphingobium sp.]|uniref:lipopolysaccharide biosynthesis protein n=1 Tax=Novosphingobium sp. TaxID=1874826 RepID=UPI00286E14F0|nr:lipopolysaccharide biosynthesis protein [Novosphingobium sp.]
MRLNSVAAAVHGELQRLRNSPRVFLLGLASLALRLCGMAVTFGTGVILARMWGPGDFGVYGLVISLSGLFVNIVLLGTPQLAVRDFAIRSAHGCWSEIRDRARRFQFSSMVASLLLLAAAGLVAFWRGGFLGIASRDLLTGAVLTAFVAQVALLSSSLRGIGQMGRGQFMDILGRPATLFAILVPAVLIGHGVSVSEVLYIQLSVAIVAFAVSQVWFGRATLQADHHERLVTGPEARPAWLKVALPLGMIDILRQLDGTYGLIIIGWLSPGDELGLYRVALSCGALLTLPLSIVHNILAPEISRLSHSGDRVALQAVLDRVSRSMSAIAVAMAAGVILLGKPLLVFAFGEAYAGAWAPLSVIALTQLSFSLFGMGPILLAMAGQERALTLIYTIGVAVGASVAVALLLSGFGGVGGALAQFVSITFVAVLSDRTAYRQLGVHTSIIRWRWAERQ